MFKVTGVNWETRDGSGIRDYIHVWDLAMAHIQVVDHINRVFEVVDGSYAVINLDSGKGVTVLELLSAFELVFGRSVKKEMALPRPGDIAGAYANTDTALRLIDWRAD